MAKAKILEKPTVLGARVYRKHRGMLTVLKRKMGNSTAEVVRRSIEELYARLTTAEL